MIILFKYCADVKNCGRFNGFGFIYIYIYRDQFFLYVLLWDNNVIFFLHKFKNMYNSKIKSKVNTINDKQI